MTCTDKDCLEWRDQLKRHHIVVGGWDVWSRERALHSNRLQVNISFTRSDGVRIEIPRSLETRLDPDDCNGDSFAELISWCSSHPIKTGYEYELEEFISHISSRDNKLIETTTYYYIKTE